MPNILPQLITLFGGADKLGASMISPIILNESIDPIISGITPLGLILIALIAIPSIVYTGKQIGGTK